MNINFLMQLCFKAKALCKSLFVHYWSSICTLTVALSLISVLQHTVIIMG